MPLAPRLAVELARVSSITDLDDLEWSQVELSCDLAGLAVEHLEIFESRLVDVRLTGAQLDRLRLTDVVIENCELSGAVLADVSLTRVEFRRCQMAALQLPAARLRDVRFINCKLDEANFRTATGERVQFDETQLVAADFYEAKIRCARFFDCDLTSAEFSRSELPAAVLQGSALEALQGAAYLKGVTIDSAQILPFALRLIGAMDICIDDNRSASN
jgi:uncharacterized protein YjbI with pentapeptide repeats